MQTYQEQRYYSPEEYLELEDAADSETRRLLTRRLLSPDNLCTDSHTCRIPNVFESQDAHSFPSIEYCQPLGTRPQQER